MPSEAEFAGVPAPDQDGYMTAEEAFSRAAATAARIRAIVYVVRHPDNRNRWSYGVTPPRPVAPGVMPETWKSYPDGTGYRLW